MKFLLDENLSNSLYNYLKNYFDSKKVGIDTQKGITDKQVIDICLLEDRILITRDCGDMGKMIYKIGKNIKGVICLKGEIRGREEINAIDYIFQNIKQIEGKFIIIDKDKKQQFNLRIKPI